jgi:pantoate--beta-alanine ligase
VILRLDSPAAAAEWCAGARRAGSLGFVPTMGALHAGHAALVRRAARQNDAACVSVFVNPLQFDDPRDLERYPRDLDGDARLLEGAGCALVFTGTLEQFFPEAPDGSGGRPERLRDPGAWAAGCEGAHRPGHFAGVATIVARLFELVRPTRAYFGEKDFQQAMLVRELARELGYPEVVVCPTLRAPSGLALSSRNQRLSDAERERAAAISRALFAARELWRGGERDADALRGALLAVLEEGGIEPEYAELRDPERWSAGPARGRLARARALIAARVGPVRLIDNLSLDAP